MKFAEVKEKDLKIGKIYYDMINEEVRTELRFSGEEDGRVVYFTPVAKQDTYFLNKKGLIPFWANEDTIWYEKTEN